MKKFLMLLALVGTCSLCSAQKYPTLYPDGRKWIYMGMSDGGEIKINSFYTMTVCGDTIVDGKKCRKLHNIYNNREDYGVFYEEDGRVYRHNGYQGKDSEFILIMDFNMHLGDKYHITNEAGQSYDKEIIEEDSVEVNGVKRRRLKLNYGTDANPRYWVEGIGYSNIYAWLNGSGGMYDGYSSTFYACYDNGELVFTKDDFKAPSACGITTTAEGKNDDDGKIYDTSGIRIANPEKGKIYIKNGKKYIGK